MAALHVRANRVCASHAAIGASPAVTQLALGAMHCHYALLGGEALGETQGSFDGEGSRVLRGVSEKEWALLLNFLTVQEVMALKGYKGFKPFLPFLWALDDIKQALVEREAGASKGGSHPVVKATASADEAGAADGGGSPNMALGVPRDLPPTRAQLSAKIRDAKGGSTTPASREKPKAAPVLYTMPQLKIFDSFESHAFAFRGHCGQTNAMMASPVPYPYFHALKILLLLSLGALGYAQASLFKDDPLLSLFLYSTACAIMIGLQEIACAMADPFGDDAIDFVSLLPPCRAVAAAISRACRYNAPPAFSLL